MLSSAGLISGEIFAPASATLNVVATDPYGNSASGELQLTIAELPVTRSSGVMYSGFTLVQ
jgi:hypothetical protein